jgi:hypothetical protein
MAALQHGAPLWEIAHAASLPRCIVIPARSARVRYESEAVMATGRHDATCQELPSLSEKMRRVRLQVAQAAVGIVLTLG